MKIILQEDVEKLGEEGEIVEVADGYARNYLIPRKMAIRATKKQIKELKREQERRQKKEQQKIQEAQEMAEKMEARVYEFPVKAGEQGRLFGSVTTKDIAGKLKDAGFSIEKQDIQLEENIKSLGVHRVTVKLYGEVSATVKVKVVEA